MNKYALIITADSRLLPGVHAQMNAMKYYGMTDVDFYLLYWPGDNMFQFLDDMKASGHYPNFTAINLTDLRDKEGAEEQGWKPVYYLKFYRTFFAGCLTGYDAVGFLDADRALTGDITPYFKLAADTGQIVMIDYKYSPERRKSGFYDKYPIQSTSGAPFDPCATFFDQAVWGKYFEQIHTIGQEIGRSEMPSVNYMLIKNDLLDEIIRLPKHRWNTRKWGAVLTEWGEVDGQWQFHLIDTPPEQTLIRFRHQTELDWPEWDSSNLTQILGIHGRWHFRQTLVKKTATGDKLKLEGYRRQNHNVHNIWEIFKYFNFDCYTHLEPWMPEWGSKDEYIDAEAGEVKSR